MRRGKEQDKEHVSDSVKESEKKARGSGETGENTPPGEEAKEKSRSEEEAIKQRRLRNKVKITEKSDEFYPGVREGGGNPIQKGRRARRVV